MNKVAIVGCGIIGGPTARRMAKCGKIVYIVDPNPLVRQRAIDSGLFSGVFATIDELPDDIDRFIEAVPEAAKMKEVVITAIGNKYKTALIFITSSMFPCSMFAGLIPNPARLMNAHILPDLAVRLLVELQGPGKYTDASLLAVAKNEFKELGFNVITVKGESPGFIFNYIWHRVLIAVFEIISRNGKTNIHEIIDSSCMNYFGNGCAPCMAVDLINVKTLIDVYGIIAEKTGRAIPQIISEMYAAGKYGLKEGEGFYKYKGTGLKSFHATATMLKNKYGTQIVEEITDTIWQTIKRAAIDLRDSEAHGQDEKQIIMAIQKGFPMPGFNPFKESD